MTAEGEPAALLFDLGGVLVDIDFRRAFDAWADAAGAPAAAIASRFSFDPTYQAYERGEIGEREYFASLRPMLRVSLSDDDFLAGWNAIFVGSRPGVEPMLHKLAARWPLYVFSNTSRSHKSFWEERYRPILAPIKEVFCSCDIGRRKPTLEAYADVCSRVGLPANRIAFFDDLEENVLGARAAGLRAFQVRAGEDTCKVLAQALW